jgi:hypothetical protein
MIGNNLRLYAPVIVGSVLAIYFTLFATSGNVSAQDAPDYLLGNLTLEKNPTEEQTQEALDKVKNYTSTMLKEANGNDTKLTVLLFEDMAKRNIIDEDAKQGFLAFVASLPEPPMETLPGTLPRNLTIPGNTTDFLKDLDVSSTLLNEIAVNNSDSQVVTLMTDILKKKVTDIGTLVSGNGTATGPVTISSEWEYPEDLIKGATCAGLFVLGGTPLTGAANAYYCVHNMPA